MRSAWTGRAPRRCGAAPAPRGRRRSSGPRSPCRRTRRSSASTARVGRGSPEGHPGPGRCRASSGSSSSPIRPMSWYSGSQETTTSSLVEVGRDPRAVEVVADVAVPQHHALGLRGGTGRELQDRERVGIVIGAHGSPTRSVTRRRRGRRARRTADRPPPARRTPRAPSPSRRGPSPNAGCGCGSGR